MANNRLILRCTTCNDQQTIARYTASPDGGWVPLAEEFKQFLTEHTHFTQWGANLETYLEIPKDEEEAMPMPDITNEHHSLD